MSTMKLSLTIEAQVAKAKAAMDSLLKSVQALDTASAKRSAAATKEAQAEADMATLGLRANKEIRAEIDKITAALQRLRTSEATAWSGEMSRASDAATVKLEQLQAEMAGTGNQVQTLDRQSGMLSTSWGKLTAAWVTFQALLAGGGLVGMIEDVQRLNSRLESSEGSSKRAAVAMAVIEQIAQDTGTPLRAVADAYVKFSNASQRVGGTQQQTLKFTEALTKALVNSGASAETSGIVMMQLGQAFDANRLSGDEFKSVAENAGKVLDYLTEALGVSRGELRKMSEDGELTADKLLKLADASDLINKDFEKMPRTVGQSVTKIVNAFAIWGAKNEVVRKSLSALSVILEFVAKNLGKVLATSVVATMGAWLIAVGGVAGALEWLTVAAGKASTALALLSKNPWIIVITVGITALIWLWDEFAGAIDGISLTSTDKLKDQLTDMEVKLQEIGNKVGPALDKVKEAIAAIRKETEQSAQAAGKAFEQQTEQVDRETAEQTRLVKERFEEEKRQIQETKGDSDTRLQAEAEALARSVDQQAAILREGVTAKMAILDQEYGLRKEVAARMVDTDRERERVALELDNELLTKKRDVLAQMLSDYRTHIDSLNAEAQRNLEAAQQVEEQKRQLSMSVEEKIRSMRQSAMGEYEAYQDKVRQVDELTSKARQALSEGDNQKAEEFAKKAIDNASQIARSVTENGQEMVSQQNAVTTAIGKVTEAEQIAKQAMDARKTSYEQSAQIQQEKAQALQATMTWLATQWQDISSQLSQGVQLSITTNVDQVKSDLQQLDALIQQREVLLTINSNVDELQGKVKDLQGQLETGTVSEHEIQDNADQVEKALSALDGRVTSSTHIIHEVTVHENATGGWADNGPGPVRLAGGGSVWKRLQGWVNGPGTPTSDSVRAMLSRTEFVVRSAAATTAAKVAPGFMEALNAISTPGQFAGLIQQMAGMFTAPQVRLATGGSVSEALAGAVPVGSHDTMTVAFQVGGKEYPVEVAKRSKPMLTGMLAELDRAKRLAGR